MTSSVGDRVDYVKCALCCGDETTAVVRTPAGPQIVRCRRDGLVYVNPRPAKARIRETAETFVRNDNRHQFDVERGAALLREAKTIQTAKEGGNLLDIGGATGSVFSAFPRSSWRLFGVEPCAEPAADARDRYGADVFCGVLRHA